MSEKKTATAKVEQFKPESVKPETAKTESAKYDFSPANQAADKVVKLGVEAVREFWETGACELPDTQSKFLALGREASQDLSKPTATATRHLTEALDLSRENIEALVESGNATSDVARSMAEEIYGFANQAFANGVE